MHTLATRSHGIFCEKYLSKTTNTLLYISTRVSLIAFKFFVTCSQMPGNEYGGNNSTSPKCGKWSIFANQVTYYSADVCCLFGV